MNWAKFLKPVNWHDDAKLLPLMGGEELAVLADDIEAHHLQNPIVLFNDKVLDGRNRLRACAKKGIRLSAKDFIHFHPNGLTSREFVLSQNLHRRQLTVDQRAALAAKLVPLFRLEAEKRKGGRPKKGEKPSARLRGKSTEQAARLVGGVSTRYVEKILALEKKQPGAIEKIKRGGLTITEAQKEIDAKFKPRPLVEQFVVPPFTILDARQGYWKSRKEYWAKLGASGGHNEQVSADTFGSFGHKDRYSKTSAFDPVLAECIYRWFCPPNGHVLDPFAGEAIKGIVAAKIGIDYTGVEYRAKQVAANQQQARRAGESPKWICGDSAALSRLLRTDEKFDLIFTSPPYYDLEQYSGHKRDGSSLATYGAFLQWYEEIFRQAVARLKTNRFLVVKVGEIRDGKGFYRNFVGDNVSCFTKLGLRYYNEAILITSGGSNALRVRGQFPNYRKLVHAHQNVLCFFKGDSVKAIPQDLGQLNGKII